MAIALSGTTLYAAGGFTSVNNGAVARNRIAAFDTTTTGAALPFDPNVNGSVGALAVSGATVYAGGAFSLVNGVTPGVARNRIVAFDGTTGAVVAGFDPNSSSTVNALAISGATLSAGGAFVLLNGTVTRNSIAALNPADGTVLGGFDANLDSTVNALAVAGSRVYAGGTFNFAGAGTIRNRLAAIKPDGTLDPDFNPNVSGFVRALAASGSTLYAGGDFTTVNGATARNRLAAFDATTGAVAAGFDPNVAATVRALAVSGSKVYAGGDFTTVNGATTRNRLAALDAATGVVDPAFNPNLGNSVFGLALSGTSRHAGGNYITVGPNARLRHARFSEPAPTAATGLASAVAGTTATLAGTVDPHGLATTYVFEYGASLAFGSITPPDDAAPGTTPAPVSASLAGLAPHTTYYYRLVATSAAGTAIGSVASFTTTGAAQAPVAITLAATAISAAGATLHGQVNPDGEATTFTFEYDTTTTFGSISAIDVAGATTAPGRCRCRSPASPPARPTAT